MSFNQLKFNYLKEKVLEDQEAARQLLTYIFYKGDSYFSKLAVDDYELTKKQAKKNKKFKQQLSKKESLRPELITFLNYVERNGWGSETVEISKKRKTKNV